MTTSTHDKVIAWAKTLDLDLYVVGGAVRDELIGRTPKDVDFLAAGASIKDIEWAAAPSCHKLRTLKVADRVVGVRCTPRGIAAAVEICPPRREVSTGPGHDDFIIVADGKATLVDDLSRRDFSVNAIARRLATGEIHDPYGGVVDIERGLLHVLTADSFRDDPLRIMRGLARIAADDLTADRETNLLMKKWAHRLEHVSGERIGMELIKLLEGRHAARALAVARDTGVFGVAFPDLVPIIGFEQESKYHDMTVDDHTFAVVGHAVELEAAKQVRLAALFHDVGKPASAWRGEDGRLHYYENLELGKAAHEVWGRMISHRVCRALGYARGLTAEIDYLVAQHMWEIPAKPKPVRARRFIAAHGLKRALWLIDLKYADLNGKGTGEAERLMQLADFAEVVREQAHQPTEIRELAIDGEDILELGIEPGPVVGVILGGLLRQVIGQPQLNEREWLLRNARKAVRH